jgi:hypothetical protein
MSTDTKQENLTKEDKSGEDMVTHAKQQDFFDSFIQKDMNKKTTMKIKVRKVT